MAKHSAKFGGLPSVQRCRCSNEAKMQTPLKCAGYPKPVNRSWPLVGQSSAYCEGIGGDIAV